MDGFARPARPAGAPPMQSPTAKPAPAPQVEAQPMRAAQPSRPVGMPAQPMRPAGSRPVGPEMNSRGNAAPAKSGGGWKVVLQFVVGLLVIVGVAAAIVFLYIKYYQQ